MLPFYYWLMPWVVTARWMIAMLPPPPTPQTPSAEIIPFPERRAAAGRSASA